MMRLLAFTAAVVSAAIFVGPAVAAGAGGVTGPAFYVDGELYRTVGTPTDVSGTGAPSHSFDTIYDFGMNQRNVATAGPGDPGYNGGRWRVQLLGFQSGYAAVLAYADAPTNGGDADGVIDSDEELAAAFDAQLAYVAGAGPSFVCPVIKVPRP